jgi:hypothetical protein
MAFYGFAHRYGANMRDDKGDLIGTLHVFPTRNARDTWLEDGPQYTTERLYRTAVKSRYAARYRRICADVEQHS